MRAYAKGINTPHVGGGPECVTLLDLGCGGIVQPYVSYCEPLPIEKVYDLLHGNKQWQQDCSCILLCEIARFLWNAKLQFSTMIYPLNRDW